MKASEVLACVVVAGWLGIITGLFLGAPHGVMAFFALLMFVITVVAGQIRYNEK
jgi:hypothetical protein